MARTVVALEVTEESVRAAEVTVARSPQLVGYGEVPLPADAAKDSEIIDPGAIAVALRQLWTGARFKAKEVTLGVASRRILVREYTTQAMRPDLLRDALPYQVQDLLPVPASQAVLDFFPLSQEGDQVSGLLVAAVSESIEQIISTLDKVKIRTRHVDLTSFGLARASTAVSGPGESVAVVFVGDHTTQVVVARGGVPQFVRILPIDMPTAAVARRSGQVEHLLVEQHAPETIPAGAIRTRGTQRGIANSPAVTDLAGRVRSTLSFFATRPGAVPLSTVLVSGAGIAAEGALAALTNALDVPIRVITVADVIGMKAALPTGDLPLNLVSTVGIALGEGQ
ncbi:Type IV pilus assembly protein PilM [Microbacterium sp. cf046]|uniref:pilus assembly protein PilM n=1 Tax=Microbacterium sp. cf046 TaxID=1761803 RepID=UPI0008E5407A|nr:pilus assembly protein PilM [Microbacterium sp. cf046]SFS02635.1 Type IV pilus assembly protein PilM [Microbacterium sp. cf046]